jgi:hypothetical protein
MLYVNVSVSADSDAPTIERFTVGSQTMLGLDIVNYDSKWYLVVTNAQDYEIANQRLYRFSVLVGITRYEVLLAVTNVDDEIPYFTMPDSTPCTISVSNALNKPHSIHIITE